MRMNQKRFKEVQVNWYNNVVIRKVKNLHLDQCLYA